jgi:hypothetical protein
MRNAHNYNTDQLKNGGVAAAAAQQALAEPEQ